MNTMRTAILLAAAVLAVSTLAMPAQAQDPVRTPIPHQGGNCLVDDDPEYRVCFHTDPFNCPRVTYRGFFGQGTLPFACGP